MSVKWSIVMSVGSLVLEPVLLSVIACWFLGILGLLLLLHDDEAIILQLSHLLVVELLPHFLIIISRLLSLVLLVFLFFLVVSWLIALSLVVSFASWLVWSTSLVRLSRFLFTLISLFLLFISLTGLLSLTFDNCVINRLWLLLLGGLLSRRCSNLFDLFHFRLFFITIFLWRWFNRFYRCRCWCLNLSLFVRSLFSLLFMLFFGGLLIVGGRWHFLLLLMMFSCLSLWAFVQTDSDASCLLIGE